MEKWEQSHVKYCSNCKRNLYPNSTHQEVGINCPFCNTPLEDTNMSYEEFSKIPRPSREQLFMEAMRKLKDTDPVKYEIAMEKYKQKMTAEQKDKEMLHCPKCGSTQIQMVTRKWSLVTGFLTNKVDRVCMNCKCKF